jgi:enterochelin esterase-like enzyme
MDLYQTVPLLTEEHTITSVHLHREVVISCFLPTGVKDPARLGLLLLNDGQHAPEMGLAGILGDLIASHEITPLVCIAIHAGPDRLMEYGVAGRPDYKGRGVHAAAYTAFVMEELLPFIAATFRLPGDCAKYFAGFSLGGLSALDIVWNHPQVFSKAGAFSGSFWWRTKGLDDGYNENTDRIMQAQVREGKYYPGLQFFFETGTQDETLDRNNNGIIDSIDDTLALIDELVARGYNRSTDIHYLELPDGKHDVATWARAFPVFLKWGWGAETRHEK